jgi:hypothetical protein
MLIAGFSFRLYYILQSYHIYIVFYYGEITESCEMILFQYINHPARMKLQADGPYLSARLTITNTQPHQRGILISQLLIYL